VLIVRSEGMPSLFKKIDINTIGTLAIALTAIASALRP